MPTQEQILESIKSRPEGATLSELATEFEVKAFQLTAGLARLRKQNLITKDGEIYKAESEKAPREVTPTGELPSDFDVFKQLGDSCGIKGDFLEALTRHIFRLDYRDIGTVFQELSSLALRPDVVVRWVKLWASHLGVPAPAQATPPSTSATTSIPLAEKKWVIIGNRPVPDPEGPYSFNQVLQVIESQSRAQPVSGNEELKAMREEVSNLRSQLEAERFNALKEQIVALANKVDTVAGQRVEATKIGLMSQALNKASDGLDNLRSDIKPIGTAMLEQAQRARQGLPATQARKFTEAQKQRFSEGWDRGTRKEQLISKMTAYLWENGPALSPEEQEEYNNLDREKPKPAPSKVPQPPVVYE